MEDSPFENQGSCMEESLKRDEYCCLQDPDEDVVALPPLVFPGSSDTWCM